MIEYPGSSRWVLKVAIESAGDEAIFIGPSPAGKAVRGGLFAQTFCLRQKVTAAIPKAAGGAAAPPANCTYSTNRK